MAKRALAVPWITTYYEQIDKISEAPVLYNMWAAISVVSAVLKNHVYLDRGVYTILPNQYIILVGPPGVGKGTAIHPAYDFPIKQSLINLVSDRNTAAKIIDKLSKGFPGGPVTSPLVNFSQNGHHPPGTLDGSAATIKVAELQTLLSSSDWMTTFLCETWDRIDFEYDTKTAGTAIVKDMCVSLIGACVPAYIQSLGRETAAAINGGFTARSVFVYADEKSKNIMWPMKLDQLQDGADIKQKLQDDLIAIANLRGEFTLTPEAKTVFEQFYVSKYVVPSDIDSDIMLHFKSRIQVHVFKVSMALSASAGDDLTISKQDMQIAINLVTKIQANLDRAFRGFGSSIMAEVTSKIQEFIEHRRVTTRKEILKYNHKWATPEDLDRILSLLKQIDYIREAQQGGEIVILLNTPGNGVIKGVRADLNP